MRSIVIGRASLQLRTGQQRPPKDALKSLEIEASERGRISKANSRRQQETVDRFPIAFYLYRFTRSSSLGAMLRAPAPPRDGRRAEAQCSDG
jgi:hypothetical protein